MKWIFLVFIAALTPMLITWLRQHPQQAPRFAFVIGLLPFLLSPMHLYVAPISWPGWQGTVKGLEVSLLDAVAFAVVVATPKARAPTFSKVALGIILVALAISTAMAGGLMPPIFYVWQLARTVLVVMAMVRLTAMSPEAPIYALAGMGGGLFIEAITASLEFARGQIQAGGHFGHQNTLGLASHFAAIPAFALFLAGRRVVLAGAILACEVIIVFVGGSRATIGLFGIGIMIAIMLSLWLHKTGRKTAMAGIMLALGIAAVPVMMAAIERRPEAARADSNEERAKFERAAQMIIADHPMGVGADRYVVVANLGGYSDRAGVPWNMEQRAAPVHNSYYVVTAEMGFLGLIGYLALIFGTILYGIRTVKHAPRTEGGEMAVGVTAALIVAWMHAYFEWTAMTFAIHYLYAVDIGVLYGLGYAFAAKRQAANRPPPVPLARIVAAG